MIATRTHFGTQMLKNLEFRRLETSGLDMIAELGTRPDFRPVRLITNGRRHRPVGTYFSLKSRRMLPWESHNELHDLWRAEVNTDVVQSWAQPHTLKITQGGNTFHFTPDRLDRLCTGAMHITEVKDTRRKCLRPDYMRKLELARVIYNSQNWSFKLTHKEEIESQPTFRAIEDIQSYRCTEVTSPHVLKAQALLSREHILPLRRVRELYPAGPHGFAIICALIVRRVLKADLRRGFGDQTPLCLVKDSGS